MYPIYIKSLQSNEKLAQKSHSKSLASSSTAFIDSKDLSRHEIEIRLQSSSTSSTRQPSRFPSRVPTRPPTAIPSIESVASSLVPNAISTYTPTVKPSKARPSPHPTFAPSKPTMVPSNIPTLSIVSIAPSPSIKGGNHSADSSSASSSNSMDDISVIGISVGIMSAIIVIVFLVAFFVRRRRFMKSYPPRMDLEWNERMSEQFVLSPVRSRVSPFDEVAEPVSPRTAERGRAGLNDKFDLTRLSNRMRPSSNSISSVSSFQSRFSSEVITLRDVNDLFFIPGSVLGPVSATLPEPTNKGREREVTEAMTQEGVDEYAPTPLVKPGGHRVRIKPRINSAVVHVIVPPTRLLIIQILDVEGCVWGKLHPVMFPEGFDYCNLESEGWTMLRDCRSSQADIVYWERTEILNAILVDVQEQMLDS